MPTYEYECRECQVRFERLQRFSDPPVETCPECTGTVRRVLHPAGIIFKGSGWYITDNRPSGKSTAESKSTDTKDESDTKPADKSEATSPDAKASGASDGKTSEKAAAKSTAGSKASTD